MHLNKPKASYLWGGWAYDSTAYRHSADFFAVRIKTFVSRQVGCATPVLNRHFVLAFAIAELGESAWTTTSSASSTAYSPLGPASDHSQITVYLGIRAHPCILGRLA